MGRPQMPAQGPARPQPQPQINLPEPKGRPVAKGPPQSRSQQVASAAAGAVRQAVEGAGSAAGSALAEGALVAVAPEMDAIPRARDAVRGIGGFLGNRGAIALEQKVGLVQQMQRPRDRQGDAPPPPPQAIMDAQDVRSPNWQPNQGANNSMSALVPVPDPNHMMPRGAQSEGNMVPRSPIAHFVPQDRPGFALAHEQMQDEIGRSQALFQAQQESLMREEQEQAQQLANAQMVALHLQDVGPPQEGFWQAFARMTGICNASQHKQRTQ